MENTWVQLFTMTFMRVELNDINFKYPKGEVIFKDFNLSIEDKEFTCLLGPNGSGKSTLIKLILGAISPSKGTTFFNNSEFSNISERSKLIGYIPQSYSLDGEMFVEDSIAFIGSLYGLDSKSIAERKSFLEKSLALTPLLQKQIKKLSGGQKQLINIALGLVHDPEILLLDEPFVGLDYGIKSTLLSFLNSLNKTIICITHDLKVAETNADTIVLLKRGKILEQRKPSELINQHPYVLTEIDFKEEAELQSFTFSEGISFTLQNRRATLSYKLTSALDKEIEIFNEKYRTLISSTQVYRNNLTSTLVGLHNFSVTIKGEGKKHKKKNKKH